ncbi:NUDIX hydrolase [Haloarcula pelagica]|uniref:NUDIX hydrolase n=1 Tax=Haloarcula pelagica TaxID=3033389 RepID=UPI0024C3AB8B|nr:NUDIX domain-containing protein [Halomicroarcula sp. YJ-61-S]
MEGVDRARDRVQERLDRLTEGERSPTVNQETVVATAEQYRTAIDRSLDGVFGVRVAITNEEGDVLVTPGEDDRLPYGETDPGESIGTAARRIAQAQTGIDCVPREATEATIRGIRNGDDPGSKAVYRLAVVYVADAVDPAAPADGHWEPTHAVDAPV